MTAPSISIGNPEGNDFIQKTALAVLTIGLIMFAIAAFGAGSSQPFLFMVLSLSLTVTGSILYLYRHYASQHPGVKNNGIWQASLTSRGYVGWIVGVGMTGFYVALYWFPEYLVHLIRMMDPLSQLLRNTSSDQWFLYGTMYTFSVLIMGFRAILKYRHSAYQIVRTTSIMFFQLGFGYLIPAFLQWMNSPEFYFSYFWPLKYDYLFPSTVSYLMNHPGGVGIFMVFWGAVMSFLATPVLTYFFGKRWYCSWVCGCGGLANTLGDPFRQLSDKSVKAWKIERIVIYSVLAIIVAITILLWANSFWQGEILQNMSSGFARMYGFVIGAMFSGVIGVGFYPIMGSRVWCRFGCPMAAYLGILQKYFSRFRITTNGGQCISCGNCSTYCEMGIDVRAYAQRGENIVRASCVGCGMCSTVCPRGVLNLENGPINTRLKIIQQN
jgi:Pyruvate/2-oxoacid:ferredoxin oxidoreductase delta subunit